MLRLEQLNEMEEFHLRVYESLALYKEKMKVYHDWKTEKRESFTGDKVLLFGSKLSLFPGKLNSKCRGGIKLCQCFYMVQSILKIIMAKSLK